MAQLGKVVTSKHPEDREVGHEGGRRDGELDTHLSLDGTAAVKMRGSRTPP